jgi:hypothetical protein
MFTSGRRVCLLIATVWLVVAACGPGGDTAMYVTNESEQPWYVSVLRVQDDPGSLWVVRVNPGADDQFAVSWTGGPEVAVGVLGPDCASIGVFRQEDDGWVVDAVPGLKARVQGMPPIMGIGRPHRASMTLRTAAVSCTTE